VFALAALVLAASTATPSSALTTASPWWEKVTFTISGDGSHQSCQYQTSLASDAATCDAGDSPLKSASGEKGVYTKITIERRFNPGQPNDFKLETGDTLLGGQVMSLGIDGAGKVRTCEIVNMSGDVTPAYGCAEARAERFQASVGRTAPELRHGFMTVLVYGHEEYPV
jgi:hypothetical protein